MRGTLSRRFTLRAGRYLTPREIADVARSVERIQWPLLWARAHGPLRVSESVGSLLRSYYCDVERTIAPAQAFMEANSRHIKGTLATVLRSLSQEYERCAQQIRAVGHAIVAANARQARRTSEAIHRILEAWFQPGTFVGDVCRVTSTDYPDSERVAALRRLAQKSFRNPVHPARWPLVWPELERRAEANGTSVRQELLRATMQSIPLALADVDEGHPISDYFRACRAALANHVTDELAGPGWRRQQDGTEVVQDDFDDVPDDLDVEYQAELSELWQALRRFLLDLPPGQRQALQARLKERPLSNAEHQALYRLRGSPARASRLRDILRPTPEINPLAP